MKIAVAADHGGYKLKEKVKEHLLERGIEVEDLGTHSEESVDYPIYGKLCGEAVASGQADLGVVVCGTGIGISIAANKVEGAYAALAADVYSATRARLSNDANIICMGAFTTGSKVREEMTQAFLTNEFEPGCASQPKVDAFVTYDKKR